MMARRRKKVNRSAFGNVMTVLFLILVGIFMALPLVFAISASLKPMEEVFRYPPTIFPQNPTTQNFSDLFVLMNTSWVPFSRYFFNTIFITAVGTFGQIVCCSLCAFALSLHKFPGNRFITKMIELALMFNGTVLGIPTYMIMSSIGFVDTQWAVIVPVFASALGLHLIRSFMTQIPISVVEAARIDGAGHFRVFWSIVMPNVKSAWLTLMIFAVQGLWNTGASLFIQSESLKTLSYALSQIVSVGIARTGVANAVSVIMMSVPIIMFIISQSNIIETMATSGMKE
ncbi:MAG: carbohydrate ABC transporter permease [Clostridiales bacterium]|nr:carbohydrate ABC transporter permease [Clostridiales bacterium]